MRLKSIVAVNTAPEQYLKSTREGVLVDGRSAVEPVVDGRCSNLGPAKSVIGGLPNLPLGSCWRGNSGVL